MIISTHVLDLMNGRPAAGLAVSLERRTGAGWQPKGSGVTGSIGRPAAWHSEDLQVGRYRLEFDTARYFASLGVAVFYPEVVITFFAAETDGEHEIRLLLGPHAYATFHCGPGD